MAELSDSINDWATASQSDISKSVSDWAPKPVDTTDTRQQGQPLHSSDIPGSDYANAASKTPGAVMDTLKQWFEKAAGPMASTIEKPIQSATQTLGNIIEAPNRAIKGTISGAQEGENPLIAGFQSAIGTRPESNWSDIITQNALQHGVLAQMPAGTTEEQYSKMTKPASDLMGSLVDWVGDPAMYAGGFGETAKGMEALKAGRPAATLGEAADKGERYLFGIGETPIIQGKPVLKAMSAVNQGLNDLPIVGPLKQSLTDWSKTTNTPFNYDIQNKLINPRQREAPIEATKMFNADTKTIQSAAKELGTTPEELNKQIVGAIEPTGSQNKDFIGPVDKWAVDRLPEQVKPLAQEMVARTNEMVKPGDAARQHYIEHNATPEAIDFIQKQWPKFEDQKEVFGAIGNDSAIERGSLGKYTINEINNKMLEGEGHKIPEFGNLPQFSKFRGKLFDDDASRLSAQRWLEDRKVTTTDDFMDHIGRTYGTTPKAWNQLKKIQGGEIQTMDPAKMTPTERDFYHKGTNLKDGSHVSMTDPKWVTPDNPEGKLFVPREIAGTLSKVRGFSNDSTFSKITKGIRPLNQLVKIANFGIYPASVVKVELGNQSLAMLNGLHSPLSMYQGHDLATRMRLDKFTDKPVLYHPDLGPITDRQLIQMAEKNGGINMGQSRIEVGTDKLKEAVPLPEGKIAGGVEKLNRGVDKLADLPGPRHMLKAHNFVEDGTRLGTFIEALKKGYSPEGAGSVTRKSLIDYSELGQLDKDLTNVAPFYNFARHNMENMAKVWLKHPGQANILNKIQQTTNKSVKGEENDMPENMIENNPIYAGRDKNGNEMYLLANHLWPANDLNEMLGSGKSIGEIIANTPTKAAQYLGGMLNPGLKEPIQQGINYDMFFKKPIQTMPGEQGHVAGINQEMPVRLSHALNQFRPIAEVGRAANENLPPGARIIRALTGANVRSYNPTEGMIRSEAGKNRALAEADHQIGLYKSLYGARMRNNDQQGAKEALLNYQQAIKNKQDLEMNR